jgi:hypothetical protein
MGLRSPLNGLWAHATVTQFVSDQTQQQFSKAERSRHCEQPIDD